MEETTEINEVEEKVSYDLGEDFDVFADDVEETTETVEEPATTATEVKPAEEPETVKEPEVTKKTEEEDPVNAGFKGAYLSEKEKRQALEQRIQQLTAQQKAQPAKELEFDWSNPEAALKAVEEKISRNFQSKLLDLSEANCKARHSEDYDEKYSVFVEMATKNPSLISQMTMQADPAEWAYNQATKHKAISEIGADPDAYRARIEAEVRAKILAETGDSKTEKLINEITNLPPSASEISGTIKKSNTVTDDPLKDVFGDR